MNKLFIFGLGAATGSLLTWKLIEKKYKDLADEEIASVVEHFKTRNEPVEPMYTVEEKSFVDEEVVKTVKTPYKRTLQDLGYDINEDEVTVSEDKEGAIYIEPKTDYVKPYVIAPEEFGEREEYGTCNWTLYSDLVITDDIGDIVVDPEEFIGDTLECFGQYEDDALHVRNENIERDYEIIKIEKSFSELNTNIINNLEDNL